MLGQAGPLERESEKKTFDEEHKGNRSGCDKSESVPWLEDSSMKTRIRKLPAQRISICSVQYLHLLKGQERYTLFLVYTCRSLRKAAGSLDIASWQVKEELPKSGFCSRTELFDNGKIHRATHLPPSHGPHLSDRRIDLHRCSSVCNNVARGAAHTRFAVIGGVMRRVKGLGKGILAQGSLKLTCDSLFSYRSRTIRISVVAADGLANVSDVSAAPAAYTIV
ncbi:hypothetical protein U1Q18_044802 [Sarracenia purpurea var. burkii]